MFLAFRKAHQTPAVQVVKDRDVLDIREADTDFAWEQLLALRARKAKLVEEHRPFNDGVRAANSRRYLVEDCARSGRQPIQDVLLALEETQEECNGLQEKVRTNTRAMAEIDRLIDVQTAILKLTPRGRTMLNLPS